ncbi:MAG: response regulator transcription factor [Thermoleophilia bacterium]|nr:response regulator transcription factor [Thermoleophilia bacterium]
MDPLTDDPRQQNIRVLICDDHDLIRQALRSVISAEPDMDVIAEAADGEEAVALATDLQPDAVVMDIQMPKLSGIEATRRIKQNSPNASVLVLTVHDDNEYILRILEAGASGYLTKGIISQDIPIAIRSACNGESMLSEEILRKLLNYALQFPSSSPARIAKPDLTDREVELLSLAAKGYSNKSIANILNITENTVKKYMMTVFDKLGVHSRTAAVIAAQQLGLFLSRP